jgi:lysyl-tRNA synthetase class 1
MRWAHERVDFEPAGKDHHSEGGSFDTAENIVREVYGFEPPVSFQYDFIGVKGRGGKISSSAGGVVSLRDVLEIYQPEVVRYLFAGTRPNSEFSISFDLDVIKIYEDYDRCERAYYGAEQIAERRREKERRSYELSQLAAPSAEMPVQIPFRHLCNRLQIAAGDVAQALEEFGPLEGDDLVRAEKRAACAWNWITSFAPEDFRFHLKSAADQPIELGEHERRALTALRNLIRDRLDEHDEKSLNTAIYDIARAEGLEPKDFFRVMYQVLVGKEKGPRLAGFVFTIGRERILEILDRYPE